MPLPLGYICTIEFRGKCFSITDLRMGEMTIADIYNLRAISFFLRERI